MGWLSFFSMFIGLDFFTSVGGRPDQLDRAEMWVGDDAKGSI